jgi:hypothetical protein
MMKWVIITIAMMVSLSTARIFETQFKFTLFGINKGWIYLDKMTIAPGNATIVLETHTTGLPYGKNTEIFFQAVKEPGW